MMKFCIKSTEVFLSYTQVGSVYGPPTLQLLLTVPGGRTFTVDWELLELLIEPVDGDSQVFLDGIKQRLSPPKLPVMEELVGMRMTPKDDGSFEVKTITKPKEEGP